MSLVEHKRAIENARRQQAIQEEMHGEQSFTDPAELHDRLEAIYHRLREFPEASRCEHGTHLKRDAYVAFLDLRKVIETEVLPLLAAPGRFEITPAMIEAGIEAFGGYDAGWDSLGETLADVFRSMSAVANAKRGQPPG